MATQAEPGSVARSLQHEVHFGVARRRRVERSGERDRRRGAAAIVARRGTVVGAGQLEQQRQRNDEADGRISCRTPTVEPLLPSRRSTVRFAGRNFLWRAGNR